MSLVNLKDFNRNNYFSIPCFYDSHLHLEGLGKYQQKSNLNQIKNLDQLQEFIKKTQYQNSETIEAFGLRKDLLRNFEKVSDTFKNFNTKNINYYLVLEDGHELLFHGTWLADFKSKFETQILGLAGDKLRHFKKRFDNLTFLFDDSNRFLFDQYFHTRNSNCSSQKANLLAAQSILFSKGITHCRDLTSDLTQFRELILLASDGLFDLRTETFFSDFFGTKVSKLIADSKLAKKLSAENILGPQIQHKGVKLFVDGTFSQNTVDLTCSHINSHRPKDRYTTSDLINILKLVNEENLEIAFHTMGDGAVEKILDAFNNVKESLKTRIHLEHCELINMKTMNYLLSLEPRFKNLITFHFQPSHYLADQKKIEGVKKVVPDIYVFPWFKLLSNGFSVHFGSDAPIKDPGLGFIFEEGFRDFFNSSTELLSFWPMFIHPRYKELPSTFSVFDNTGLLSVFLNGKKMQI